MFIFFTFISASCGCVLWLPHSLRVCRKRSGGYIPHRLARSLPPRAYVVRGFQPDVWSVHTAVHFQPGCFQSFFHGAGVVHIVVNRFFYLPSAFCGVDGFGGTLGNVACTIKLGALAAVPQFVEGDTFTFQRSGGQFFRYYGVAAAYACKSGCL